MSTKRERACGTPKSGHFCNHPTYGIAAVPQSLHKSIERCPILEAQKLGDVLH